MILFCNYAGKYDTSIFVGLNHVQIINSFISSRACVIKAYRATTDQVCPGLQFSTMYRKEKPLVLKSSASSLSNNLSVLVALEKGVLNYAVVHKAVVNIISASTDGSTVNSRNIVCKEPSAAQQSTPMIIQVKKLHQLPSSS